MQKKPREADFKYFEKIDEFALVSDSCVSITALDSIKIEDGVTIGNNVVIVDHDHDISDMNNSDFVSEPIVIRQGTWIGANCVVLKGVSISDQAVGGI